jgi:hypothetical protein
VRRGADSTVESAIATIFDHREVTRHRHFFVSVFLPVRLHDRYPADSGQSGSSGTRGPRRALTGAVLYIRSVVGIVLPLTAVYMGLPGGAGPARARPDRRRDCDLALGGDPPWPEGVLR